MAEGLFDKVYNPDVLSCLANLSNDEVFTPPEIANQMLDMLPQELFENPDTTFLDPACKSGVFLREIAKRLLKAQLPGYENMVHDIDEKKRNNIPLDASDTFFEETLQKKVDHIFHKQLYGIAITELTSLLSRRSVYCSKYPDSEFSITKFDSSEGNIRFRNTKHTWKDGNCVFCGISSKQLGTDKRENLESHAYEMIHVLKPEEIFNLKFDVIISNPPYQLSDGGNAASALPIYQKFVEQAQKLNSRFITMIIPSRWFTGGRGLDDFRDKMLRDDRIRVLHDFPVASDCFPGVEIKGGVCYFLWDRENRGICKVCSHNGETVKVSERPLLEPGMETFIRNDTQISVLNKVRQLKEPTMESLLNAGRFYGFHTKVEWDDDKKHGKIQTADGKDFFFISAEKTKEKQVKVYIHGGECWIANKNIPKNKEYIDNQKVIIPRSGNPNGSIIGKPKVSEPGSCSSNSYVVCVLPEDATQQTAINCISYIQTKFFRYLVSLKTVTQDCPPKAYSFVPVQNFSVPWNDRKLYEKYGLSDEEINEIEQSIPEMNIVGGDTDA